MCCILNVPTVELSVICNKCKMQLNKYSLLKYRWNIITFHLWVRMIIPTTLLSEVNVERWIMRQSILWHWSVLLTLSLNVRNSSATSFSLNDSVLTSFLISWHICTVPSHTMVHLTSTVSVQPMILSVRSICKENVTSSVMVMVNVNLYSAIVTKSLMCWAR